MSSTRRSSGDGPIRQERYASSAGSKGLLGNLVARRAAALQNAQEREMIYFLHELSLRDGHTLHYTANLFPAWPAAFKARESERAFERVARWIVTEGTSTRMWRGRGESNSAWHCLTF